MSDASMSKFLVALRDGIPGEPKQENKKIN